MSNWADCVWNNSALFLAFPPERGRIVPELQGQGINIFRELIMVPWRIVYRLSDTTVYVLSSIDSRQNVEDILLNRLLK